MNIDIELSESELKSISNGIIIQKIYGTFKVVISKRNY